MGLIAMYGGEKRRKSKMTSIITEAIGREDVIIIKEFEGEAHIDCPIYINGITGYVEQIEETTNSKKTLLIKVSGNLFAKVDTRYKLDGYIHGYEIKVGDKLYVPVSGDLSLKEHVHCIVPHGIKCYFIARALEPLKAGEVGTILVRLCNIHSVD